MTETKPQPSYWILGQNLLVMLGYNIVCRLAGESGVLIAAFAITAHVILCLVVSFVCIFKPAYKAFSGMWLLSGILVLIIGFSTCVGLYTIKL